MEAWQASIRLASRDMRTALTISLLYLLVGVLWILFSDILTAALLSDPDTGHVMIQTIKGWFFVLVSSGLIFALVLRRMRRASRADSLLRQREQFYRSLFENTGTATIIFGDDRIVTSCNTEFERLSGYPREEVEGVLHWPDFVDAQDLERMEGYHSRRFDVHDPPPRDYDFVFVDKEGVRKDVHIRIGVVSDTRYRIASFTDISQEVRAREKLEANERRFRELYENAPVGIFTSSPEGRYLMANTRLAEVYGYDTPDRLLEDVSSIQQQIYVDPEEREKLVQRLGKGETVQGHESRRRKGDGSLIWVSTNMRGVRDETGKLLRIEGFTTDITRQKLAEKQVRKSEERLSLALDAVNDAVWDWRVDTGEVFFSPRWYTMLGLEPYELLPSYETWRELLHPDDVERTEQVLQDHIQDATPFEMEFRMRAKAGGWKWILARGKMVEADAQGRALRLLGMHMDITERKLAQDALAESEARFSKVFRSSPAPTSISEIETGRLVDVNDKMLHLLGYDRAEVIGRTSFDLDLWPDPEHRKAMIKELQIKGSFWDVPTEFVTKHGETVWVLWSAEIISLDGKQMMLSLFSDITERRQFEIESATILETAFDGFWVVEPHGEAVGQIVRVNESAVRMLGYTHEEMLQLKVGDIDVIESPELIRSKVEEIVSSGGMLFETRHRRKDGSLIDVEVSATYCDLGRTRSIFVFIRDITARKQTELELERIFTLSPDMICVADIETATFLKVNPAFEKTLGYSTDELLSEPFENFIHPDDRKATQRIVQEKLAAGEEVIDFENRFRTKAGEYRWLSWVSKPVPELGKTFAVAHDVTGKKASQLALVESEQRFRNLFENAPQAYQSLDENGYVLDVNRKWLDLLGYAKEEIIGAWFGDFLAPGFASHFDKNFPIFKHACVIDGVEFELVKKNGEHILVAFNGRVQLDKDGNFQRTHCIFTDITEERRAEQALRESESRSRAILNAIPDMIFQISLDGRFTGFQGRKDLLLQNPENFLGKTVEQTLPPDQAEATRKGLRAIMEGQEVYEYEYPLEVDGEQHFFEARMVTMEKDAVLILVRDVTAHIKSEQERSLLEKQLRQAQKMEAVGTLAGGIAHDFNNILAAIVNLAVLARRQTEDELLLQDMDQITTAALRGKDLVRQVLFFSRKSNEEQVPVQAASQVKEIVKFLRSSTPTTITIRQELNDEGMVLISPTHLHQIVVNICSNGVEAMLPGKGSLNIRLSPYGAVAGEVPRPATDLQDDCLVLTIRDSGPGIDPALEERVFDPFFTTKPPGQGTGLGLAVVHGLVKEAGGDILLENHPGKGCAFHVFFPRHSGRYEVQPVEEQAGSQGTGRILFVDDEEAITDSSVRVLQMHGFQATGVVDPVRALEMFTADPQAFDLAVVDLTMPRMSGKDLIRKLKALREDFPVILSSGYALETDQGEHASLGVDGTLNKPVRPSRLISEIRKLLALP